MPNTVLVLVTEILTTTPSALPLGRRPFDGSPSATKPRKARFGARTPGAAASREPVILEKNGMEPPKIVKHINVRVKDVVTKDPVSVSQNDTMLEAGRLLRKHNVRSLVVRDDDGEFWGSYRRAP